ncbi:MAG: RNA polymerase sigma-54 factor, partial [Mariprofundales bacterium]|nr:RNA polymerase sigma-54 factor [Mariprofundales bacterium]
MAALQNTIHQKLGQQLALTPQLTQSLRLLAMNSIELDSYIDELLESNPLLEAEQVDSDSSEEQIALEQHQADSSRELEWREGGDDRWESMYRQSGTAHDDLRDMDTQHELSLGESLHEQIDQQPMSDLH